MVFAFQLFFTKYFQILESGGGFGSLTGDIQTQVPFVVFYFGRLILSPTGLHSVMFDVHSQRLYKS